MPKNSFILNSVSSASGASFCSSAAVWTQSCSAI